VDSHRGRSTPPAASRPIARHPWKTDGRIQRPWSRSGTVLELLHVFELVGRQGRESETNACKSSDSPRDVVRNLRHAHPRKSGRHFGGPRLELHFTPPATRYVALQIGGRPDWEPSQPHTSSHLNWGAPQRWKANAIRCSSPAAIVGQRRCPRPLRSGDTTRYAWAGEANSSSTIHSRY
jgi:hypothetical protein